MAQKQQPDQEQSDDVVHVAVAVIRGDDGRILVAKRPDNKHMGGLWEFPGGKVEPDEDLKEALNRELMEELAITVSTFQPLITIRHQYPEKTVLLDTWLVSGVNGTPKGNEGQEVQWVEPGSLTGLDFPPANEPIVNAVLLPSQYMVTGLFSSAAELIEKVSRQLENGLRLIQFRAPWLQEKPYLHLARELHHLCQPFNAKLLLKGDPELLQEAWCDGIHLRSDQLSIPASEWKKYRREGQWLAASCHNEEQLQAAEAAGMDFVTLSPVRPTKSHPGRLSIGQERATELTLCSTVPVYWLGGLGRSDESLAIDCGAQGIAAIGAFWSVS
ncbi:Nudix family hydrolase [Endozoicomonas gorgoniicola]|uniref:8-oxo-dGTP diphosphatase n=1 Tax=Endozoicomonas gorgoniicola TaxID=1234144 RepID=A0ABT3MW17_9GAMM|nr:Nudix family hydrolase [Endozoicomonas gorgoniicola]MCW7553563.1 Nudix family hydrolase [Endozoicomonas gorgoniicola]